MQQYATLRTGNREILSFPNRNNFNGEHPSDRNHQDFPKSTAIQMGGVLQYKWEAYCDTNGRSTDSIPLSSELRVTRSTPIQIGGVLQYKLEVYCDTFLRSSGGWGFWHSSDFKPHRFEIAERQRNRNQKGVEIATESQWFKSPWLHITSRLDLKSLPFWRTRSKTFFKHKKRLSPHPSLVIFFFPYNPPHPPSRQTPRPSHPRELDFGPFRVRLAPFRVRLGPFGSMSGPFRVRFGFVSGCWVGSGWGQGGVRECGFCKGKEDHWRTRSKTLSVRLRDALNIVQFWGPKIGLD